MTAALRRLTASAAFAAVVLAAGTQALAGVSHGYPPTVRSDSFETERYSDQTWSTSRDEAYPDQDDEVGYLPASFFADAGGVGPYPIDYGYGGGGYVYVYGAGGGFAGARGGAGAHVSVSVSGFHGGHGGFHHHGGHGCGCR